MTECFWCSETFDSTDHDSCPSCARDTHTKEIKIIKEKEDEMAEEKKTLFKVELLLDFQPFKADGLSDAESKLNAYIDKLATVEDEELSWPDVSWTISVGKKNPSR